MQEIDTACTDGSTELIIEIDSLPQGTSKSDVLFYPLSPDGYDGSLIGDIEMLESGTIARQTYRVPQDLYSNGIYQNIRNVTFQIEVYGEILQENLQLRRPPVILLYGLWGKLEKWGKMLEKLHEEGFDYRFAKNYKNDVNFSQNKEFIKWILEYFLENLPTEGVAVSKVDVVAHSMGGCLVKKYGDPKKLRRVITIGTPYKGSILASILYQLVDDWKTDPAEASFAYLLDKFNRSALNGAIHDLQISNLIENPISADLNSVECLEIIGIADTTVYPNSFVQSIYRLISLFYGNSSFFSPFIGDSSFYSPSEINKYLFKDEPNDWVVSVSSQWGDGSLARTIPVKWHIDEIESDEFIDLAILFLKGKFVAEKLKINKGVQSFDLKQKQKNIHQISINQSVGEIQIIQPRENEIFNAGKSIKCTVKGNGNTDSVFIILEDCDDAFCISLPCEVMLNIPENIKGELNLIAIGFDSKNNAITSIDSLTLQILNNAKLQSIILANPNPLPLSLSVKPNETEDFSLIVIGHYSDDTYSNISSAQSGTVYKSSDSDVVIVNKDGIMFPRRQGTATILIQNDVITNDLITVVTVKSEGISLESIKKLQQADINKDGVINYLDLLKFIKSMSDSIDINIFSFEMDLNNDNVINMKDLLKYIEIWHYRVPY